MKYLLGAMLFMGLIGNVNAAIYKCIGADKKVTYSEEPCSGKIEILDIRDNTV
jgi:hypothetical protein